MSNDNEKAIKELRNFSSLLVHADCDGKALNGSNLYSVRMSFTEEFFDVVQEAISALEKQNKYRWHDLRKDKDDLPTDDRTVLVCIVHDYCDDDGWFTYDFGWFIELWFTNCHCRGIESQGYKVIAWLEIEPFKERN